MVSVINHFLSGKKIEAQIHSVAQLRSQILWSENLGHSFPSLTDRMVKASKFIQLKV